MAKKNPLYKKNGRYYADFRGHSDVGGGQEAMVPDDERYATKDYRVAKKLAVGEGRPHVSPAIR